MLNARVTNVTSDGVEIAGQPFLPVRTVFWAAGVQGSPLGGHLGVPTTKSGQVIVNPDLTVPAQSLSAFTGTAINGAWKLRVRDLAAVDNITLEIPRGTVSSRLRLARESFRESLARMKARETSLARTREAS